MEDILRTYEAFAPEILGVAFALMMALECMQLWHMHRLKERVRRLAERQQLKNEMDNSRMRESGRESGRMNRNGKYEVSSFVEDSIPGIPKNYNTAGDSADARSERASSESRLISDILEEIFP